VVLTPRGLLDWARTPEGRKLFRYTMVSVISVAISQVTLLSLQLGVDMKEGWANLVATAVGTVPSYELNRKWAWGKTGKGHFWKEVVPFWALSFLGLAMSEYAVVLAGHYASHHHFAHLAKSLTVNLAALLAFGVLWVAKFVIFNKWLFAHHPEQQTEAWDGRTGVPT